MKKRTNGKINGKYKGLAVAALVLGCLTMTGISAYFTATDTANNAFTVGNISLELQEPNWSEPNGEAVLPGQEIHKDPQILNDGINDEFVFLEVVVPYSRIQTANEDGSWNAATDVELFSYDVNTTDWVQVGDPVKDETEKTVSYVYAYAKDNVLTALEKDDTTSPLFEYVRFANVAAEAELVTDSLNVVVNAYGIQTTNINDGATTIDGVNNDGKTAPADVWAVIDTKRPELQ